MSLSLLVNQSWNKSQQTKAIWGNFSDQLSLLKNSYCQANIKFITGLDNFTDVIRKGYGTSIVNPDGYALNCDWTIKAFIQIFEPIMTDEQTNNSLMFSELVGQLANAKKYKYSKNRLLGLNLDCDIRGFADILKITANSLEDRLNGTYSFATRELIITSSANCGLLSSILYSLNNKRPIDKIEWCQSCFRRSPPNSMYCYLHQPKRENSNNKYKKGRGISEELKDNELFQAILNSCRVYRNLYNNPVSLLSSSTEIEILNEKMTTINVIATSSKLKFIVEETLKGPWQKVSTLWEDLLATKFPFVNSKISQRINRLNSWIEFLAIIRLNTHEFIETNTHPDWIIYELIMAENWLKAEHDYIHRNDYKKLWVKNLRSEDYDVREICKLTELGKSRVYEILSGI